jgi:hypothetical protein
MSRNVPPQAPSAQLTTTARRFGVPVQGSAPEFSQMRCTRRQSQDGKLERLLETQIPQTKHGPMHKAAPKKSLPPEPSVAPAGPAGILHLGCPTHRAVTFATLSFESQLPLWKLSDVPTAPLHEPSGVPHDANNTSPMLYWPQFR